MSTPGSGVLDRRILYYVDRYLPASQSFVAQQAKALTRFVPEMLAGRLVDSPSRAIGDFRLHDISGSYAMRAGELAVRELGFRDDRVFRHYIGIDTALFQPRHLPRLPGRVVSIARFVEYKGHQLMIDALATVAEAGIPIDFVMVGQGPLKTEMEAYARKRLPVVTVYERLPQAEIAELLATAQLYLHGSVALDSGHAEAFGIANLEAQAVGTPVVAFRSGGVAEAMLEGRTGEAVAERDVRAMAAAIASLLGDVGKWQSFSGAASSMVAEHFDIRGQARLLEDFYDRVIEAHAAAARTRKAG